MAAGDPLPAVVQPDRVSASRGSAGVLPDLRELERRIGYQFKEQRLLSEALTHGSATRLKRKGRRTNERLEFLGDRVVGLATAELLIRRYPDEPEGALTPRLSGLVSKPALAEAARELDLGAWLEVARSEEQTGGRKRPAILADALEALMGARLSRRRLGGRGRHRAPLPRAAPRDHGGAAAQRQVSAPGMGAGAQPRPAPVRAGEDRGPGPCAGVRGHGGGRRSAAGARDSGLQARRRAGGGGGTAGAA